MTTRGDFSINLPRFDYMCQKNTFTGSYGSFRYKVFPEKKDEIDTVIVAACYENNCFEVEDENGRVERAEFEYSNEGIDRAEAWIADKYSEKY